MYVYVCIYIFFLFMVVFLLIFLNKIYDYIHYNFNYFIIVTSNVKNLVNLQIKKNELNLSPK